MPSTNSPAQHIEFPGPPINREWVIDSMKQQYPWIPFSHDMTDFELYDTLQYCEYRDTRSKQACAKLRQALEEERLQQPPQVADASTQTEPEDVEEEEDELQEYGDSPEQIMPAPPSPPPPPPPTPEDDGDDIIIDYGTGSNITGYYDDDTGEYYTFTEDIEDLNPIDLEENPWDTFPVLTDEDYFYLYHAGEHDN
jgi:hypothetical protein